MWTSKNRARLRPQQVAISERLTDDDGDWSNADAAGQDWRWQAHGDHAEVVNGLMYILSTGCQWRAIRKTAAEKLGLRLLRSVDI